MAAVPPGHPLAGREAATLAEVTRYPIISLPPGTGVRAVFDQDCAAQGGGRTSRSRPARRARSPTWPAAGWAWPFSPRPWRPDSPAS